MMAQNNHDINKGTQKLQLSSHIADVCIDCSIQKDVNSDLNPNRAKELLANSASQKQAAGSAYFKTFEQAVINRLLSDLVTELEALNFDAAEVIFENLLNHMSEPELEIILVERGIVDLVMKNLN